MPKLLTGGVACYRIYSTADGRLSPSPRSSRSSGSGSASSSASRSSVGRQWEARLPELEQALASRPLAEWLELFEGEDVSAGPVATLEEAAAEFSSGEELGVAPQLGEHTQAWRDELGV